MSGFHKDTGIIENLEVSKVNLRTNYDKEFQLYQDHVRKKIPNVLVYPLYSALKAYKNCQLKIQLVQLMLDQSVKEDTELLKIFESFIKNDKFWGDINHFEVVFQKLKTYGERLKKDSTHKESFMQKLSSIEGFAVNNHFIKGDGQKRVSETRKSSIEDCLENLSLPENPKVLERLLNEQLKQTTSPISLDSTLHSESEAPKIETQNERQQSPSVSLRTHESSDSIHSAETPKEDLILEGISKHKSFVDDPNFRMKLFETFVPTFYFHKNEKNFPINPDDYIKEVITAKYTIYQSLWNQSDQDASKNDLQEEFRFIETYLWDKDTNEFSYSKAIENEVEFKSKLKNLRDRKIDLFTFDEKKYGYKDGHFIKSLPGVLPEGYKGYDNNKRAPLMSAAIATEDGFFLRFEYSYAVNNVIPGLGWLRKILPWSWAEKLNQLGFHYGDCEGVGVYLKCDETTNEVSISALQTFAHGRSGARIVPVEQCTVKDGHLSVFVGLGGHPSYADNFVLRSRFFDKVGDKWKIAPQSGDFVDGSLIIGHTGDQDKTSEYDQNNKVPKIHLLSPRMACANNMLYDTPTTEDQLNDKIKGDGQYSWNHYSPNLFFTKIYHKIKDYINKHVYHKLVDTTSLPVVGCEDRSAEPGQTVQPLTLSGSHLKPHSSSIVSDVAQHQPNDVNGNRSNP